ARRQPNRGRKNPVRQKARGHAGRALANARELYPLAELVHTPGEEGIRFQIAGMSAAILQGVPATTLDTDIWIDLPERQYVKLMHMAQKQGGTILARTVCALSDGSLVNFLFSLTGLKRFATE